jgi:hypothetical protein
MRIASLPGMNAEQNINIVIINKTDADHLEAVQNQMSKIGAPAVRAIWSETYGLWFAAEGSHRITAAKNLGLIPEIIDITGQAATVQRDEEDTEMTAEEIETWLTYDVHKAIIVRF